MEHRKIATLEERPSLLGYGCMRFPTLENGDIREPEAMALIERALAGGVNYFDTAYFYHGGRSEDFMYRALSGHPRGSYYLTSKLPTTMVKSLEDAKRIFGEQMERLRQDRLDFYFFHNLNGKRWHLMIETGVLDWYLDLWRKGVFRHTGFSFHGTYEEFREILTARSWDCCQLQLNYMDTEEQAGLAGYRLTEELGVPLIIMEPVKGGALARPPREVETLFRTLNPTASPASWALRWAASLPNVMTVLSGMSTMEQLEDNLATFHSFRPLDEREAAAVEQAAEAFRRRTRNGCTGCRYCMPCPAGVNIPGNFKIWNEWAMYGDQTRSRSRWREVAEERRPERCISCGACEEQCPQKISVRADLMRMKEELDRL